MDQALAEQLLDHEGFRSKVYDDQTGKTIAPGTLVVGIPTIGIGRNLVDNGLTREEAVYLLGNDVARFESEVRSAMPWFDGLDPVRQRVLLDMAFNVGTSSLLKFQRMLGAIQRGEYSLAAQHLMDSKYATQVGRRAVHLAHMLRTGTTYS